jgi:cytoskeletal protein CcmA (bactofilin family)
MGFFKKDKKDTTNNTTIEKAPNLGSKISRCMVINGDVVSCESIIVDGRVNGDIISSKEVIVNRGSIVVGKIEAKVVRVDGILEGPIEAQNIKVGSSATTVGYMIGDDIDIKGRCDGDILAKNTLTIQEGADVTTVEAKAKSVKIYGLIRGLVIAKEELEIGSSGVVEGDIKTKSYISSSNSKVTGSIFRYVGTISNKNINENKNVSNKIENRREVKRIR